MEKSNTTFFSLEQIIWHFRMQSGQLTPKLGLIMRLLICLLKIDVKNSAVNITIGLVVIQQHFKILSDYEKR